MSTSLRSSRVKTNVKSVSFLPPFWPHARSILLVQYVHIIQELTNSHIGDANSLQNALPDLEPQLL